MKKPKKRKVINSSKTKKDLRPPFISQFNKRHYTKIARDYHHEVLHLVIDLRAVNIRVRRSYAVWRNHVKTLLKTEPRLIDPAFKTDFEDLLYHIENYCFRASAFRDKLLQFVNYGLRLGYDERERNLIKRLLSHKFCHKALLHTELKKFENDSNMKSILKRRIHQSHLRYYSKGSGCDPYLLPNGLPSEVPKEERLRKWDRNVQNEVLKIDKFTMRAQEMCNNIIVKLEKYLEEKQEGAQKGERG